MAEDSGEATDLTWKIVNYSMFRKGNGKAIHSPMFSAGNPVHSIWYLKLYPKGASAGSTHVVCDLIRLKGSFDGRVNFTMNLVTSDGRMKESVLSTNSRIFLWNEDCRVGNSLQFKPQEFVEDFLSQDTLTLKCYLKFEGTYPQYESGLRELSETISWLFNNKEMSDLTLYTCDKEFSLHQAIVLQRAPAFLADLGFQIKNSKNNRFKVDNMSTLALQSLIRYLYSGCIEEPSSEILVELYSIAEKYQLAELSELACSLSSLSTLCTQVNVVRKQIKWNILDVSKKISDGIHFEKYINLDNFKFLMNFVITYNEVMSRIEMGFRCVSKLDKDIALICKISLSFPGKNIRSFDEIVLQFLAADSEKKSTFTLRDYYRKGVGSLQLFLNLALSDCRVSSSVDGVSFTFPERPSVFGMGLLSYDLSAQFESNQNKLKGDVTLIFGDRKVYANKAIISSWSPMFCTMFHHDMKEKITDEVVVADIDHHTGRRLIQYMYSGIITQQSFLEDSKLYEAADKYQVLSLFKRCSDFLLSEISIENACEGFVLAHLHSDENLFESVLRYIKTNQKEIQLSSGWKLLADTNLNLASVVLEESTASK